MNLWEETEARFGEYSPAARWGIVVGAFLLIVGIGYFFWVEPMERELEARQATVSRLKSQVARTDPRRYAARIRKAERERLAIEEALERVEAAHRYLQSRMRALGFAWFDQKSFLVMLERFLKRSVELGVRIDRIETEATEGSVTPLIEKKCRVAIEGAGRFPDIVRLVDYLESFEALQKVTAFRVWLDEEGHTRFAATLLVYGAKP
ncbi:type II secretion system protein GspM [Hydrogenimonas sp.]